MATLPARVSEMVDNVVMLAEHALNFVQDGGCARFLHKAVGIRQGGVEHRAVVHGQVPGLQVVPAHGLYERGLSHLPRAG
jgi:hypothetical protein